MLPSALSFYLPVFCLSVGLSSRFRNTMQQKKTVYDAIIVGSGAAGGIAQGEAFGGGGRHIGFGGGSSDCGGAENSSSLRQAGKSSK